MHKWSAKKHKMQISKQKLCFVFELFPETQYLQLCNYGIRHATLNDIQIYIGNDKNMRKFCGKGAC